MNVSGALPRPTVPVCDHSTTPSLSFATYSAPATSGSPLASRARCAAIPDIEAASRPSYATYRLPGLLTPPPVDAFSINSSSSCAHRITIPGR